MHRKVPLTFLLFLSFLFNPLAFLQARNGKVFFSNGRWLKGDIQIQTDPSGREIVVIALDSGSVIVPKSDVKNIVYPPLAEKIAAGPGLAGGAFHSDPEANFHRALQHTARAPGAAKKSPSLYEHYIRSASTKHQLDPELIKAVIKQESNFNREDVSSKGAGGLMQLMPETAKGLGVEDVFDPWENIHGGTRYLRMMLEDFHGDLAKALAAYNAGPAAVKKYGKIPPYAETQGYVRSVLRYYQMYRGSQLFAFEDKKGKLVITDKPYVH